MENLLFHELRLIPVHYVSEEITQETMLKAVTANQELLNLGYTLSPKDVVNLARTKELDSFPSYVRHLHGDVKAKPMYPGFPEEVMKLDEAVLRFHQFLHYLSTYGLETFSGQTVLKGWLPDSPEKNKKRITDRKLLDAKVIALVDVNDMYITAFRQILSKTERMTTPEKQIILKCIPNLTVEQMTGIPVKFKQNLLYIFHAVFADENLTSEQKQNALHALCQHTGDVLKCTDYVLSKSKYHFKTSQKRLLTKLLESYPAVDFKANLILSDKKSRRSELIIRYLDFNLYSRSEDHKKAVAMLRNGELQSWEGQAKALVSEKNADALSFIARRPGMMLRMLTYLLRNGYTPEQIQEALVPNAGGLRTQTIITLLNHFGKDSIYNAKYEANQVFQICEALLLARLAAHETPLKDKKIFISLGEISPEFSRIETNDKSDEGGYLSSGMVYQIPEGVHRIRFFVYWNDKTRVDVDLHAAGITPKGEKIAIGWNNHYRSDAMAFSGDITHSDAAEYIDLDLDSVEIDKMTANIHLYYGRPTFAEVETCFAGCMAVSELGQEVKLYDPKNCIFVHHLHMPVRCVQYGYIDVKKRIAIFVGREINEWYQDVQTEPCKFNLGKYLEILEKAQNVTLVSEEEKDQADLILVTGKPSSEKEISLVDNNFFMDK